MRVQRPGQQQDLEEGCLKAAGLGDLEQILSLDWNTLLWPKPVDLSISSYCEDLVNTDFHSCQLEAASGESGNFDHISSLIPELPDHHDGRIALINDIKNLWDFFSEFELGEPRRLSFEKIESDMCQLFHADKIRLRLLCTYRGLGTEWLPNEAFDRSQLGQGCNSRLIKDESQIYHLAPFEVGIFKGENFPGNQGFGSVHRSPRWQGQTRLLLKIDSGRLGH